MQPNIFATEVGLMIMTAEAMARLEENLERDRAMRGHVCPYCQAQVGDPCHTRRGSITPGRYHVPRMELRR